MGYNSGFEYSMGTIKGDIIPTTTTPPHIDHKPLPQTECLAPPPGFKLPESNLMEFGHVADSSTLLGGVDSSSIISNPKYSTPSSGLGGSFTMPFISRFFQRTAKSNSFLPARDFVAEILDLQPHFEASRNPGIKLDLSLVPLTTLTTPQHPISWLWSKFC